MMTSPRPTEKIQSNAMRKGLRVQHDGSMIKSVSGDVHGLNSIVDDPGIAIAKVTALEKDLERRQETYVARERAYKARIDELEEEINILKQNKTGWMATDSKIVKLRQMQNQIMGNIDLVQDRTAKILQEQERDLLKAFRARLYDVQTELDKEKSKKDDGVGAWIDKCNALTSELEWSKSVADRLERVNQSLMQDNSRLRSEYATQEEDRNFVITQLVTVKKENARLRAEYSALETDMKTMKQKLEKHTDDIPSKNMNAFTRNNQNNGRSETEDKYKEINTRLKRLLVEERKSLQALRQQYASELSTRSELEMLLRQCVEDVRKDIARKKIDSGMLPSSNDPGRLYTRFPGLIPIDSFTREDRDKVLELLLSQERVITMLYAKTFPINSKSADAGYGLEDKNLHHSSSVSFNLGDEGNANSLHLSFGNDGNDNIFGSHESRPHSSKLLGSPGERDREREKVKLPMIGLASNNSLGSSLTIASLSRPTTGSK